MATKKVWGLWHPQTRKWVGRGYAPGGTNSHKIFEEMIHGYHTIESALEHLKWLTEWSARGDSGPKISDLRGQKIVLKTVHIKTSVTTHSELTI